jgi:hypothetical protein
MGFGLALCGLLVASVSELSELIGQIRDIYLVAS